MFRRFTDWWVELLGHPVAFVVALCSCIVWGALGPIFGYSDTWQLIINTATTVVTFLMLFVLQSAQNRDTAGLHAKLDLLCDHIDEVDETQLPDEHR